MVALSLEISQIFWDAGFASAIVIVGVLGEALKDVAVRYTMEMNAAM